MKWTNILKRAAVAAALAINPISLAVISAAPQASTNESYTQSIPNLGRQITPFALRGARYELLNPMLADNPQWRAGQAVSTVVSPDHNTLLILTSGYNRVNGATGARNNADSSEYVFVYDVSQNIPVQKQVIAVPNTYNGIVFDPSGTAFYVAGGVNDNVHFYSLGASNLWAEQVGSPVSLGHASGVGAGVSPAAAGLAVTQDGTKLVIADYFNDSISILTKISNVWSKTAEYDLRPGKINAGNVGVPGGEYPFWVAIKGNDTAYVSSIRDREIDVVNIAGTPILTNRIKVKGQPNKMVLNATQSTLYAAEDETDSVAVIDTVSNQVTTEVPVIAPAGLLPSFRSQFTGANTNSVALSPDGTRLYVTNGNLNNVAVVDLNALGGVSPVIGLIPTGWYPNSVSFNGSGSFMYVVSGKTPPGPNAGYCHGGVVSSLPTVPCRAANQYDAQLLKAGFQAFPTPTNGQLSGSTAQVAANNNFQGAESAGAQATMTFLHQNIQHVIYIIKENRTYDQILGDLPVGNGNPALTEFGQAVTPNYHNIATNFVDLDNFYDSSEVSYDGWAWSTAARAPDLVEREYLPNYAGRGLSYDSEGENRNVNVGLATAAQRVAEYPSAPSDPDVLPGVIDAGAPDGPGNQINTGHLWDQALRAGLTVRNYGFFVQNINSAVINPFASGIQMINPVSASLRPYSDVYYRGFDMNMPDYYLYSEWLREYKLNFASGGLPNLTLLRIPHDHTGSYGTALAGVNTPELQEADNDYAVALVIQTIANSQYANNTLVFVIEDDAQDGGDHVDAHRSTAYVVGPYVRQHAGVSTPYNTINFIRTMEEVLGLAPLNLNDSLAQPMADVFDVTQKSWTFTATPSALLYNTQLPLPARAAGLPVPKPSHSAGYWADATKGLDFSTEDKLDGKAYNRLLWKGLMGNKPYADVTSGEDLRLNRAELLRKFHELQQHQEGTSEPARDVKAGAGGQ